jgi:hypothetical protein
MDFACHRLFRRSFRRRVVSAALAAMYMVTAGGIPLPAGNIGHKSGEMFPCSDDACGCASAEQCWRSCCCHSLRQRMEWAREHKVRPPEFAIADARRTGINLAWLGDVTAHGTATHLNGVRGMICTIVDKPPAEPGAAGAFTRAHVRCCCAKRHENANSNSTRRGLIIGWKALNCQGQSANWVAAVPGLISANREQSIELPLIKWLGPALSEVADHSVDLPAIPPPKTVSLITV